MEEKLSTTETTTVTVPVSVICNRYKITQEEIKTAVENTNTLITRERTGFLKYSKVITYKDIKPILSRVVYNRSYVNGKIFTLPVRQFFGLSFDEFSDFCRKNVLYFKVPLLPYNVDNDFMFVSAYFYFVFDKLYDKFGTFLDTARKLTETITRSEAKKKIKHKFNVGDLISLKTKSVCGSQEIIKGFEVKKCVYTINKNEVNAIIVKQIYGPEDKIFTLNRHDCEKIHLKYEPGLQVFSMMLNWGTFKEK